jgi:hypothetical protein
MLTVKDLHNVAIFSFLNITLTFMIYDVFQKNAKKHWRQSFQQPL